MKSTNYKPPSEGLALLLIGPPKSGKSCTAGCFPRPWFADADGNLTAVIKRHPGKTFDYNEIDRDDEGQPVPDEKRWVRLVEVSKQAAINPDYDTLVFDSLTKIGGYLEDHLVAAGGTGKSLKIGGISVMDLSLWNPYKVLLQKFIITMRASGKNIIFIAHERVDKDEVNGTLTYRPNVGGQLRDTIGYLFTDVWHCEVDSGVNSSGVQTYTYKVRTMPSPRMALGNSLGLPTTFAFTWEKFRELAEKGSKV